MLPMRDDARYDAIISLMPRDADDAIIFIRRHFRDADATLRHFLIIHTPLFHALLPPLLFICTLSFSHYLHYYLRFSLFIIFRHYPAIAIFATPLLFTPLTFIIFISLLRHAIISMLFIIFIITIIIIDAIIILLMMPYAYCRLFSPLRRRYYATPLLFHFSLLFYCH
jgi:hypothetical protein